MNKTRLVILEEVGGTPVKGGCSSCEGGGIHGSDTAGDVADNFLASVAQHIVERWDQMVRANAIEGLEACLFLTQSSCKVPTSLETELKIKIINLSQYLQKGGLKK
jgi:hypothetical protein